MIILTRILIWGILINLSSCNEDNVQQSRTSDFSLQMQLIPQELINNMHLYVFDNPGKCFVRKQLNIDRVENKLITIMEEGNWNLVLFSCENNIIDKVTLPGVGGSIKDYPMWKTPLNSTGEFLEQTPEIRYATIFPATILANQKNTESVVLNRNVAKVQVILKEYSGFDSVTGNNVLAYAELLEVPTTIMWDGRLSADPADISDKPLREYFQFNNENIADTLNFIVPAHRDDELSETFTHKLKLKLSMPLGGNAFHGKTPVDISFIPKPNTIIRLFVTFRGEPDTSLDIKVSVKEWEDYILQTEEFN